VDMGEATSLSSCSASNVYTAYLSIRLQKQSPVADAGSPTRTRSRRAWRCADRMRIDCRNLNRRITLAEVNSAASRRHDRHK
jgi:hypothetical protein